MGSRQTQKRRVVLKLATAIWIGVGVWLYAQKELGTYPLSTLAVFTLLWVACALVGLAAIQSAKRNPFERMKPDERERAVEALLNLDARAEASTAYLQGLLQKYAPRLSHEDGTRLLVAALNGLLKAGYRETQTLHSGPCVVLARSKRSPGFDVTRDGSSWFGGLPALGDQPWPRGSDGRLMTPLAQIDLTGLAEHLQIPGLPDEGSLVFFASLPEMGKGTLDGSVRHVPGPVGPTTEPDGPLPRVENYTFGGPLRRGEPGGAQVLFPRQALELVPVTASGSDLEAEVEKVLGAAPTKQLHFALSGETAKGPGQFCNRDSVLRFLHCARVALESGRTGLLSRRDHLGKQAARVAERLATAPEDQAELQTNVDRLRTLLAEIDAQLTLLETATPQLALGLTELETWARAGDRWCPLTTEERTTLTQAMSVWTDRDKPGWVALNQSRGIHRALGACIAETLLVMAVAETAVFERLPEPLREAIAGPYRQPCRGAFHRMFGEPDSIQNAAGENQGSYLLLQLQSDEIAGFNWGDVGVLQYWISPRALKAGRWEEAYLTFEGN